MTGFQTLNYQEIENSISDYIFENFDVKRVLFVDGTAKMLSQEMTIEYKLWNVRFRHYFNSGNCYIPNQTITIYDKELMEDYDA